MNPHHRNLLVPSQQNESHRAPRHFISEPGEHRCVVFSGLLLRGSREEERIQVRKRPDDPVSQMRLRDCGDEGTQHVQLVSLSIRYELAGWDVMFDWPVIPKESWISSVVSSV